MKAWKPRDRLANAQADSMFCIYKRVSFARNMTSYILKGTENFRGNVPIYFFFQFGSTNL